jgi:signal transduction histidine kinase/ligand-binding sensor domain-containing protein/DNA-binding response OmpR family regulator
MIPAVLSAYNIRFVKSWLLASVLLCCTVMHAQDKQYTFSRVDVSNGLSHNQVNTIIKDKNGFLWFGTMSGLNRYDGYAVKTFRNTPDTSSIVDNYVSSIWECPGNKLWIASRNDISVFDLVTEKVDRQSERFLISLGLPAGNIVNIKKDSKNNYWFLYDTLGLFRYGHDQKLTAFHHKENDNSSAAADDVSNIAEDSLGFIWLIHRNGLLEKLDPSSQTIIARINRLQELNKGIFGYSIFTDNEDDLWIWADDPRGVFYINTKTGAITHFNENRHNQRLNNNLVNSITQDRNGMIWVATDHGGINIINKSRQFSIRYVTNDAENNKSLGQNSVTTLYKDNNDIIWIGTYKQGISYINDNITKFAHYKHKTSDAGSLQYDDVNRFVEDEHGNIWIGTNGGGLIYFDRKKNKFKQYLHDPANPNSLSNNVIVSLCIDYEKKLWIGTYLGGLNYFDGKNFAHYRHNDSLPGSLSDDRVWEIFEDSRKDLWVGTLSGGLNKLDRKTKEFEHYQVRDGDSNTIQSNYIAALIEDRRGNLWIGTAGGIDVLNKRTNQFKHYGYTNTPNSLSNYNVIDILEDASGRIWVGTREGLNLYNERSNCFRSFTKADGLPDNTILTITEDDKHTLWITTPNGLCNLIIKEDPNSDDIYFDIKNYDDVNNLQGKEFNENAALKTRSGELIVGGPYGLNIINPSFINSRQTMPVIAFTSFQVFNKTLEAGDKINNRVILERSITATQELKLRFNENVFSIEFAALDFSQGNRNRYAYRLEGFNSEWLYTDGQQRKATYTNLDPGTYYFKVKALSNEGIWSEEKALKIIVTPPFWKTPVAFVLYILVIAAILLFAKRLTVERAKMRFEVEQQRREADRMHAIDAMKTKFFTNVSHEFRTPLSLILSPLDKILKTTHEPEHRTQLQLIHRNAKRLLHLINQLLDFRKMEVQEFKLHPSPGDIIKFTKDISNSFSDIAEQKNIHFSVQSNTAKLETYFDKDKLEKILFNLLSNAFKYTPNNGKVSIELTYNNTEAFEIKVKDDGIGIPADKHERIFERFFQNDVPASMVNQGTGIGLAITKEFVRLHEGSVHVDSEPEKGTCFTVVLPVKKITEESSQAILHNGAVMPGDTGTNAAPAATNGQEKSTKKATVLLVEDNEDFRFYLKDNLKAKYAVIEAVDGKEGWQKTKDQLPDLVVSDIMMPHLTGINLSRRIKNDPRTSQIPIILLTAMDSEETQLEGYHIGINDYIAKPFTFEILDVRIKNLLAQKKQLKKDFQRKIEINPGQITITPVDEQFMKQTIEAVEKNISNTAYSVEDLSRDLFMSRVALYKKLLALTGKTPVEFIRMMRLKRGAQLLEKSQMTISEIAYEVGFNNPKIFSKYFKEEFKMPPSQYQAGRKHQAI